MWRTIAAAAFVLIIIFAVASLPPGSFDIGRTPTPAIPGSALTAIPTPMQSVEGDLFNRVNALRNMSGINPYRWNDALYVAAREQAEWMASTGIVSHFQPGGGTPYSRAVAAGFAHTFCCTEIIYLGTAIATPDDAWNWWFNSETHYAELTRITNTDVGIASVLIENRRSFVMVFGVGKGGNPTGNNPFFAVETPTPVVTVTGTPPTPTPTIFSPPALTALPTLALFTPLPATATPITSGPVLPTTAPMILIMSPTPGGVVQPGVQGGGVYVVQPGDTLFIIASRYGITTRELAQANGIREDSIIFVGQQLVIPQPGAQTAPTTRPSGAATSNAPFVPTTQPVQGPQSTPTPRPTRLPGQNVYVVQPGDTLYSIGIEFGVTVDELVAANNIENRDLIHPGQELIIP
jgi:LysM repeat protein/uncharacterized protein YkwD